MSTNPAVLSAATILEQQDLEIEAVPVPEWGGTVYVKNLSGLEKDLFEASLLTGKGRNRDVNMVNLRAKMLVKVLCDAQGTVLFTDAQADELGKKNANILDRLFKVAQRLSGYSQEEVDRLTKNSESDQNGGEPTDSP